jgi:hypothetical protein
MFHGLADLLVVERLRRAELLSELFEHGEILSFGAVSSNRKFARMKAWTVAQNGVTYRARALSQPGAANESNL